VSLEITFQPSRHIGYWTLPRGSTGDGSITGKHRIHRRRGGRFGRAANATGEVTLTNVDTNFTRNLNTDDAGRFRGVLLPLGSYRITVKAKSFSTLVREGLNLGVGQSINLTLPLTVAGVEQTVNISGEAPVIETSKVEQSTYIDPQSIRTLPNNGRNFLDFVTLTPGVSIVQGPDGNEISINGQKGINNNVSIDGADNNNPFFGEQRGGQRPPFTVNLDAVKEFQVVSDGAPAEFGRSSGGFINVVTKSGTNELHGTAHEFNAFGLYQAPLGIELSSRISAHSAQPASVGNVPADRIQKDGAILLRNTLRKDNAFFSLDFRAAKNFRLSERFALQGVIDVFNLFNNTNNKKPEVTGSLFNFDGTVSSGLGDPRQAQLGVKLIF
jgi:hypothetical protein